MPSPSLTLKLGFTYASLFDLESLQRLDALFLARLRAHDATLHDGLLAYRHGETLPPVPTSELLIACGPVLEQLIGELFGVEDALRRLRAATLAHDPVFEFKKFFVSRRARRP